MLTRIYLYVNSSNQLIYDNGSTTLPIAEAGSLFEGEYEEAMKKIYKMLCESKKSKE